VAHITRRRTHPEGYLAGRAGVGPISSRMLRGRRVAVLLFLAGAAYLVAALLNEPWQPLSFIAAGALMFGGLLHYWRSRDNR
jgi:hypothetical protein